MENQKFVDDLPNENTINRVDLQLPWHWLPKGISNSSIGTNNVLLVKINGPVWYTIYHHKNLLLKGFLQTPLFSSTKQWEFGTSMTHRIHGAGIYANIWGILMVNVTIYTIHGYTWILWVIGTLVLGPPCCESSGSAVPRVSQGYRARLESPSSAQSGKPRLLPNSSCLFLNRFIHDLGWDSPKTSLEKNMENSPWTRSTQSQFTLNWRSEQLPNHPREDWEVDLISASIQWYGSCPKCCFRCANKSTSLFSQTTMQLPEDTSLQIGNPSAHVVNNNEKHSNFKIPSGLII